MPLPKSLHVESVAGEMLDANKKAKYQVALDALTERLLPDESIVRLAEVSHDNPNSRISELWGVAALTTERLWVRAENEAAELMNFEAPISACEVTLAKRGLVFSNVAFTTSQGSRQYSLWKKEANQFVPATAAVRANPAAHVRPDAVFDPARGPWWTQLSPDYQLKWTTCRFAVDPDVLRARDGEVVVDREGVTLKVFSRPVWEASWPDIVDIATGRLKARGGRQVRGGWEQVFGEVAAGEANVAGVFLVATRSEQVAMINVKELSPTPLTRLIETLNWFVDAHWKGVLTGEGPASGVPAAAEPPPSSSSPPPRPPAPPAPPPVTQRPPQPAAPAGDVEQQLRLLASLHADGVLTDEEYAAKKQMLLDRL